MVFDYQASIQRGRRVKEGDVGRGILGKVVLESISSGDWLGVRFSVPSSLI